MKETLPDRVKSTEDGAEPGNGAAHTPTLSLSAAGDMYTDGQAARSMLAVRRRPRWIVLLAAVVVLGLAIVGAVLLFSPSKGSATAAVRRGSIISTVETTGKLDASRSAKAAFKASGQVQRVLVKQGDKVEEGQVMAELDTAGPQRGLQQALLQLQISKLRLQQAKDGPPSQDVTVARANLDSAIAQLNQVKAGASAQDITSAQALLDQAQSKLDALKKGSSTQDLASAQAGLAQAKANRDLTATKGANATEQARILLDQATAANPNLLDPSGTIEQARLNYETAKQSEKAQNSIAEAQVRQAQAALDKLNAGASPEDLRAAQDGVTQAQANLDKVKSGPTADQLRQAQSRVDAAQAALDKLNAGTSEVDLSVLEQQVELSQVSVDAARAAVSDEQLLAPIAGTVLTIDIQTGELVGGQQPVATIADTSSLPIKADIDEIDVGRVSAGQPVTVTLDAYPGVNMPGKIDEIAPGATQKQGSTVYQATVSFTSAQGVVPRQGMAANVDITAERKDNVLLLPNRAFETVGNRQYVTISQNGTMSKVEVQTGLSNNTDTEVISGLNEGQVVVLH